MPALTTYSVLTMLLVSLIIIYPVNVDGLDSGSRLRTLCLGDVIDQYGSYNSSLIIMVDPAIDATLVPTRPDYVMGGQAEVWRHMRMYLPRTYQGLIEGYDVLVTSDTDRTVFRPEWIEWMADSIVDGGLGILWLGFIDSIHFPSWEDSSVGSVLPCRPSEKMTIHKPYYLKIVDAQEPLMQILPWEESPPYMIVNTQIPKDGSRVWAKADQNEDYPLMTYWRTGEGDALCFAGHFPDGARSWAEGWRYFPEAMMFIVYRVDGRALPDDPFLFDVLMTSFSEISEMDSLLDFWSQCCHGSSYSVAAPGASTRG